MSNANISAVEIDDYEEEDPFEEDHEERKIPSLSDIESVWKESMLNNTALLYKFEPNCNIHYLNIRQNSSFQSPIKIKLYKPSLFIIQKVESTKWLNVSSGEINGWVYLNDELLKENAFHQVVQFRKYEEWKGNNIFVSCGSSIFMMGSDWKCFIATYIFIIFFSIIFLGFVPVQYCEPWSLKVL